MPKKEERKEKDSFYVAKHIVLRISNKDKCYFYTVHKPILFRHNINLYIYMKTHTFLVAALTLLLGACSQQPDKTLSGLNPADFATVVDGKQVALYTLKNASGMEVCITNFGGRIVSIMVPDRNGEMRDVVLGFDNIDDYVNIPSDFGASVGRYANRIDHGRLVIDGDTVQLPQNNFGHCLHGGPKGWQYKVYEARQLDGKTLELMMHSPDGDENFPGNVEAKVTYNLTDDNAIVIAYEATTDAPTVINMTNHSYFNLSGNPRRPILDHLLTVDADSYTPVDSTYMTTGEILPVEGTPMDFTEEKTLGLDIGADFAPLKECSGYDQCYIIRDSGLRHAAWAVGPETSIRMEVLTTLPGMHLYSANFLAPGTDGKDGAHYAARDAVCFETEDFPDAPNHPNFPDTTLLPDQPYSSTTIYRFDIAPM